MADLVVVILVRDGIFFRQRISRIESLSAARGPILGQGDDPQINHSEPCYGHQDARLSPRLVVASGLESGT